MDYRLLYTQKALKDLAEIISYIAETDAEAALRLGASLVEHANLLTRFPHIGSIVRKRPKVRKLLHSPFLVYYNVNEAAGLIEIVHIRHGARKPPRSELRPPKHG